MQHFIYQIKTLLRSKTAIFWSVLFPVFLGMMFYFMFGNIKNLEQFSEVPVGILTKDLDPSKETFVKLLKEVKVSEKKHMFQVTEYEDKEKAAQALEEKKIAGYITVGTDYVLTAKEADINSSMIKSFIDQYMQNEKLIERVAKMHPEQIQNMVDHIFSKKELQIKEISLKGQDKDPYTQYFYALLAMTCLIAASIGVENGLKIQADLSMVGARRNIAPMKKMKQVMIDFLASFFVYCIMTAFVLGVCIFVYKRDFGNNTGLLLLGTWIGSFVGLAAGTMIAVVCKGSRQTKEGISVAFFMTSSFLGGLQWGEITYYIEKSCPIINRINPATLIVNAFKSLAVFGDYRQYAVNMVTLFLIGVLFLVISISKLRRMKYASL